jgi:tetratricopeptide (TPR) repeat protein
MLTKNSKLLRWLVYILLVLVGIWVIDSVADAYYATSAAEGAIDLRNLAVEQKNKAKSDKVFYSKVDSLVNINQHDEAIQMTRERIGQFPQDQPYLTLLLGDIYYTKGEMNNAIKLYTEATLTQGYIAAYVSRGWAYIEKNEFDSAIRDLEYAAKHNWGYYYDLGVAQERNNQLEDAKQSYLLHLQHDSSNREVHLRLDTVEMKLQK